MDTETSENKISGFVDLAAGEDIPETFPGAENLPPVSINFKYLLKLCLLSDGS